ncbi:MAG: hypothetical protein E7578_06140 [Ruminococcaceae bacterium]|nr:hypothetical protein [Oscillospiraceae bacterium]
MITFLTTLLMLAPFAVLIATVTYAVRTHRNGTSAKSAVVRQMCMFVAAAAVLCIGAAALPSAAAEPAENTEAIGATESETEAEAGTDSGFAEGMAYIAAAIVTGLSGIGGGIAVAAGAPAAIGATSEDPKAFGKALIFVALGEGIALYGLLVSILILAKV